VKRPRTRPVGALSVSVGRARTLGLGYRRMPRPESVPFTPSPSFSLSLRRLCGVPPPPPPPHPRRRRPRRLRQVPRDGPFIFVSLFAGRRAPARYSYPSLPFPLCETEHLNPNLNLNAFVYSVPENFELFAKNILCTMSL
jgi:hypothetical protein